MVDNDSVNFVSQEDKISQSDSRLKMPLGMGDDGVAPLLSWVHVHSVLEVGITVAEGGEGRGKVVVVGQEDGSKLKIQYLLIAFEGLN